MANFSTRPRRPAPNLDTVLVVVAALVLAASAAGAARAWVRRSEAADTLDETREVVARLRDRVKRLQSERASGAEDKLASQLVLNAQAPPVGILSALEEVLPDDVRLEGLALQYDVEPEIEMRVVARRAAAYDEFLARLSASPRFHEIVPGAESRDQALMATVRARYRAEIEPPPPASGANAGAADVEPDGATDIRRAERAP